MGGENIPTAQGELSDLAGDEPLFKALYQWCARLQPLSHWEDPSATLRVARLPTTVQHEQHLIHVTNAAARFLDSGGVYKLAFGPKAFIVVSDPVVVRHLLKASGMHCC